jgi:hypothetical protein
MVISPDHGTTAGEIDKAILAGTVSFTVEDTAGSVAALPG